VDVHLKPYVWLAFRTSP